MSTLTDSAFAASTGVCCPFPGPTSSKEKAFGGWLTLLVGINTGNKVSMQRNKMESTIRCPEIMADCWRNRFPLRQG
eukprot:CAMPEP_0177669474 /NCGR_PEP_ID=MMETSP0447-20121125/23471_1 /TAXON_ID=0 /ORGANISM="Stygamoeba regulata, Strain BSH-02190019" /LENGTH=76 /DNA_ID=CAMNT_0019176365 /DNA_START=177 /DNA_END=404 /DNA_ORIENTATION=-